MESGKVKADMRIYCDFNNQKDDFISIIGDNYHYLKNVRRVQVGSTIDIMTTEYLLNAQIETISKKEIKANILKCRKLVQVPYSFTVYQCILKREYMDNVVSKYAELGVTKIFPVVSERSTPLIKDNTLQRYKEIAKQSALQSEQEFITNIANPIYLNDIILEEKDNFLFYERLDKKVYPSLGTIDFSMIIGPEGGFTNSEITTLIAKGFTPVSPIKSILKAETAGVVFAGLLLSQLDY